MGDQDNIVIDTMRKAEAELKKGNEIFSKIIDYMNNFINILDKIKSVIFNFTKFDNAIKLISEVLRLLSSCPIIGPFLNILKMSVSVIYNELKTIEGVLNTAKTNIDNVINTLKEYIKTARKVNNTTSKLVNDISNYISILEKSLSMLQFMLLFINIIQYIDKDSYNKIVNRINKYKKDFENITSYFENLYDEVKKISEIDIFSMNKIFEEIGQYINKAENALSYVFNIFSPITEALDKINKYLSPFKWLFDAVGFLFNIILKPAINWIMKITGIKKLISNLSDKILEELGIKNLIESITNKININKLDIFDNIKIINDENIINKLNDEFHQLVYSSMLTEIFQDIIKIDIDPDKPFVIKNELYDNITDKNNYCYMDFLALNKFNNIIYNDKNYYLNMNYSIANNNINNIDIKIDNDILINEKDYIDINKLENSKCFTYNKNDIDKLSKHISEFVNNVSNIYIKAMITNNSIDRLEYYIDFIDSYLYELYEYNLLISEIFEYINNIDKIIKNNDKYNKLHQTINKLNNIIYSIMKYIDEIGANINLLHNSKDKENLLNEIEYISDFVRNDTFFSNIKMTVASYVPQLNSNLYILDSLYDKSNDDNDKEFLKEKADNILKYILKDIEDNIAEINKDVLNIGYYFDSVLADIKDYDDCVSTFVLNDNFIPKKTYNNTFNLRNMMKNIYDHIYFEGYINNISENNTSKFAEGIAKNIDLKLDEKILNDIENKMSANDINISLDYIIVHNNKFNKLLSTIYKINKNYTNLNNYTDQIYDMIKYKIKSDGNHLFLDKEEIEKIENINKLIK